MDRGITIKDNSKTVCPVHGKLLLFKLFRKLQRKFHLAFFLYSTEK